MYIYIHMYKLRPVQWRSQVTSVSVNKPQTQIWSFKITEVTNNSALTEYRKFWRFLAITFSTVRLILVPKMLHVNSYLVKVCRNGKCGVYKEPWGINKYPSLYCNTARNLTLPYRTVCSHQTVPLCAVSFQLSHRSVCLYTFLPFKPESPHRSIANELSLQSFSGRTV